MFSYGTWILPYSSIFLSCILLENIFFCFFFNSNSSQLPTLLGIMAFPSLPDSNSIRANVLLFSFQTLFLELKGVLFPFLSKQGKEILILMAKGSIGWVCFDILKSFPWRFFMLSLDIFCCLIAFLLLIFWTKPGFPAA